MPYGIRARTATLLDIPEPGDRPSRLVDVFLIGLILINFVAVIIESVVPLREQWAAEFRLLEAFSVGVFTLEYLLRIWSIVDCRSSTKYRHPIWGRLRFMVTPMAIIDLLAVAPFWLSMFVALDLRFLRVARLLRVLKLTRYSAAMDLLLEVLREKASVIGAAMFTLFIVLILAASTAYLAEHPAQPEVFSSIPQAMWWAVITVTTVGYGDVVPITTTGKAIGAVLSLIGVGMVALPAGILASGFSDAVHRRRNRLRSDVHKAREDGTIDNRERQVLESRARSLSLSDEELAEILDQDDEDARHEVGICPHCGKPLGAAPGADRDEQDPGR